ncbi:PEPxxWA-CTERM sorting domain-containing protein [Phenylobacterium sp.]|uniref:PEPxxWA-CTERM sorting domain-containing protein n=1 Tax=Phenylobacterium sp. TaxID=1871053 RepID=UPI0025E3AD9F|nr:PEPxxWA-CTERM sorting domain-containing protein [Phenylobacterium sp.]
MTFKRLALGLAAAAVLTLPARADVANPSFETGDLTGWSFTDGFVEVVTDADDATGGAAPFGEHFTAPDGRYFAHLTAGSDATDFAVYTTLSQTFDILGPSRISGDAAFLAFDTLPYDDDAYVRIFDATTSHLLFASSVAAVGDNGHTDWTSFTSGRLGAGTYTIEAGVRDGLDFGFSSQLLLDNIQISAAAAPEPAGWALMLLGFGTLGATLRRRRAAYLPPASA